MNVKDSWMKTRWRPAMAWMYLVVCVMDFIVFPILWSILQASYKGSVTTAWMPLTLQGAGLFHLALGAILGISAWSRGQEKILNKRSDSYYNDFQRRPTNRPEIPPEEEL